MPKDMSFVSASTGWVLIGSTIRKTTDTGHTWTTQDLGRALSAAKFVSDQVGWISARDEILPNGDYRIAIMKTIDGGTTWEDQFLFTGDGAFLNCISAVDENHAWVCGSVDEDGSVDSPEVGVILATTDGGATWTRQGEGLELFRRIQFIDPDIGWLITTSSIYRSTNGGATWTSQEYPSDFRFQMNPFGGFADVIFVDSDVGWVVGDNGIILHTSSGGQDGWSVQGPGAFQYTTVSAVDADHVWTCASTVDLDYSVDGGGTWIRSNNPLMTQVLFVDAQNGWGRSQNGIHFSSDGGASWENRLPRNP